MSSGKTLNFCPRRVPGAVRHSSCRSAEPGPYQTPACVMAPALHRTASQELRAALRPGHGASVLRLVHQRTLLDPGHHVAELFADFLDRVRGEFGTGGLERGLVDLVLQHPVAGELAGLDVSENALHLLLGLVGDD